MTACPFKVGDRIHEMTSLPTYSTSIEAAMAAEVVLVPDLSRPHATVTAITERGFEYRYDCKVPIGRAAWGTWTEGGECFPEGYFLWRLARD